ncbi:HSF-type DNA-binding domain protein [Aspergillus novofumigatus IBT 16806]|uniref:HSF-type DNA-binding domain protein n=1 Tax=Aspergillus novofumigatus (strain IBT 16806) TaxID=1392255 RepID=A0A2I1C6Q1_ASPN1|nr:HSF-type DNA-binding domain protein [Aspergillus novofumigatus IBT 16806]PKX93266.1 HSF-type DNA-binding domain protein [Aspergillus novofumigatus IBT 16806]
MSNLADPPSRNTFTAGSADAPGKTRKLTVLPSSIPSSAQSTGDSMEVTPPASTTTGPAPPAHSSPDSDRAGANTANSNGSVETGNMNNTPMSNQAIGAAAAAQQPKVVQTAFIHKLYNMLEDPSIQHLISWSSTNDSFVMSPTSEFSKVLAQYFKHTNISSFVRQLNMYGFHKVSDVFHTGSPDSALWEFKHGNGNFKRGDLVGLREIKRRASRHALIHRDSFPGHKTAVSQPGTPAEPVPDATEARLLNLEHSLYDMHTRLSRAEEAHSALNSRCQAMAESLARCYHWTYSISHFLQGTIPDRDSPLYRDVSSMQKEIEKHVDVVRALENPPDPYLSVRPPFFANVSVDPGPPLSPRQVPQDDSRRPSMMDTSRHNIIRPPVPPHLAVSPRRYGSIGGGNSSPNYNRPQVPSVVPPQQPMPHPLSSVSSPPGPNLARRHTSADIRQHGWPPPNVSQFPPANAQGASVTPWPPSPHRTPTSSEQQVRDVLAQYEMGVPRRFQSSSRHATPPLNPDQPSSTLTVDNAWTYGGSKYARHESSLPATRRSSMASNVHSLLNPADTAERPEEDQHNNLEDRKRKRLE